MGCIKKWGLRGLLGAGAIHFIPLLPVNYETPQSLSCVFARILTSLQDFDQDALDLQAFRDIESLHHGLFTRLSMDRFGSNVVQIVANK